MIFPLIAPALVVVLNGTIVHSYAPVYVVRGHVVAPLEPYVTAVAASIGYSGSVLIVTRGDRFAQLPVAANIVPAQWPQTYVEIAPLMRSLGVRVAYDAQQRRLEIDTGGSVVVTPTPFNPAVPAAPPSKVFTPSPIATPRPQVSGKPAPRRTPLPVTCCTR
ncbi:MAG TPA: hypothetical protein VFW34_10935 [Candidatus Rubrimentiphilum sp.]|nr:hypothetical protein [Candidatus Rubrimentiphilum sp.]